MKKSTPFFVFALFAALIACNNAPEGQKASTSAPVTTTPAPAPAGDAYTVNTATSRVDWEGTEPGDEGHKGTISLKSGTLQVSGDQLTGGTFEVDINSINVTDLTGGGKAKLEGHLKEADFFDAAKFPTGRFVITKVEPLAGQADATHRISGNLTLRDSTQNITFPAEIALVDGKLTASTPKFTIDRTKWGVMYRSGVIGTLKNKLINDQIGLAITLEAAK
jgi:polyisoprenoid-binding protein YceI